MKRARRAARVFVLHVLEAVALIVAGGAIACGILLWRLSQGPISLDFMGGELQEALAEALSGEQVSIGRAQASWRSQDRSVGVVLSDVVIADADGEVLSRAPRLAADLSLSALLRAHVAFARLVVEGGEVSVVRTASGRLAAGLGEPDHVAARAPDRPGEAPRGLVFLRETLEAPGSMAGNLRELRFEGATLHVRDAVTGVDWRADDATLRVVRTSSEVRAEAGGAIATTDRPAVLRLSARAGPSMSRALFEMQLTDAVPSELFPSTGPLAPLSRLELPINATVSTAVDEDRGPLSASLDVEVEAGRVRVLDRDIDVAGAHASLTYDPQSDVLTIEDAAINADVVSARLHGHVEGAADWLLGGRAGPYPVTIAADAVSADLRPAFERPLEVEHVELQGRLRPAEAAIDLDALNVTARDVAARLAGQARLERASDGRLLPAVKLSGPIDGSAGVEDVLDFWPVKLADGAREWIAQSVHGGRAQNVDLDLDLPVEALVVEALDDDKLTLSFDFEGANARFISTMSPLTDGSGHAVLHGNSFELTLDSGKMAGLDFESGFVEIPRLNPKGALARFGGVVRGTTSDVLSFLDEPPLKFPSSYDVSPAAIGGSGRAEFAITRPMLVDVPVEDIGFTVSGEYSGVSAPTMLSGLEITDADVAITANVDGLQAHAKGRLGPADADIDWREAFHAATPNSTTFHVETRLDAAAFDAMAVPVRRVFTGSAGLTMDARGRGLDVAEADLEVDLTDAVLSLPDTNWTKDAGAPASARLTLRRGDDGALDFPDAELSAPGVQIAGALSLAGDGRLESLTLDRLEIEDVVDAHGEVTRGPEGGLTISASGPYADVRSLVNELARGGAGEGIDAPLTIDAHLGRATARDGVDLTDVDLQLDYDGERTRGMTFSAMGEGGAIRARIDPAEEPGQPRRFTLDAADAGEALYVLFGVNSVRGGSLSARADLPSLDAPKDAPTSATLQARRFTLAGAPPLAQILTIASLEGLANTLGGEGIRFSRLDAPMRIADGRITLDEAHAAGQALGVTVNGTIDLDARTFNLEGVLVPAYGVNSMLGQVPVIGDIFVSRRGEGVFGLTYTIEGPFEQTHVFVNPLSALAPGFLRRMFEPVENPAAEDESPSDAG